MFCKVVLNQIPLAIFGIKKDRLCERYKLTRAVFALFYPKIGHFLPFLPKNAKKAVYKPEDL